MDVGCCKGDGKQGHNGGLSFSYVLRLGALSTMIKALGYVGLYSKSPNAGQEISVSLFNQGKILFNLNCGRTPIA
jgi:hypothetical protein